MLPRFADHEAAVRAGFTLMLVSSSLLVPAAYGLEAVLAVPPQRRGPDATFGVAGALFQVPGGFGGPSTVPFLSAVNADPAASPRTGRPLRVVRVESATPGPPWGSSSGVSSRALGRRPRRPGAARRRSAPLVRDLGLALAVVWAVAIPVAGLLRLPV